MTNERDRREGAEVVHILRAGLPLCHFSDEVPIKWPPGHKWTWEWDAANATCRECLAALRANTG